MHFSTRIKAYPGLARQRNGPLLQHQDAELKTGPPEQTSDSEVP
jgi:hypothetical protein